VKISQKHALISTTVLNTVYIYKHFIRQKQSAQKAEGFQVQSNFDRDLPFFRFPPQVLLLKMESARNLHKTTSFSTFDPSAKISLCWFCLSIRIQKQWYFLQNRYICFQTLWAVWGIFGDVRYRYVRRATGQIRVILVPGIFSGMYFLDLIILGPPKQPKTLARLVKGFESKRASKRRWVGRNSSRFRFRL